MAHTLSENFISSCSAYDSNDSDLSDMELSADSFEDFQEIIDGDINNFYQNNNNLINNNISKMVTSGESLKHQSTLENQGEASVVYCDPNQNAKNISPSTKLTELFNLPQNLSTILTLKESSADVYEDTEINENKLMETCNTPDIIRKNNSYYQPEDKFKDIGIKKENKPDLLRGVSPHFIQNEDCFERIQSQQLKSIKNVTFKIAEKEDKFLGITPVDIIGDFGEEVEREFGLLVSGYRRLIDTDVCNVELPQEKVRF